MVNATSTSAVFVRDSASVFGAYLKQVPLAHALFRAAELAPLAGVGLSRPLIDLGCGQGEIVQAIDGEIDLGIDISHRVLQRAGATSGYRRLVNADLRRLPCPSDSFTSAISISVLEHLETPFAALQETYRILRPGGVMAATVVCREINECFQGSAVLSCIGLRKMANAYARKLNAVFQHVNLMSREEWIGAFNEAGFQIERLANVVSMNLVRCWEQGLVTAWPHRIFPPLAKTCAPLRTRILHRHRIRFAQLISSNKGPWACLCVVARKPRIFPQAGLDSCAPGSFREMEIEKLENPSPHVAAVF